MLGACRIWFYIRREGVENEAVEVADQEVQKKLPGQIIIQF
jgi:hypothetical protein